MRIYVEIRMKGAMEDVWRRTQDPALHERWDLRFSSIDYLPRPDDTQPQRFQYSTRIGCGLAIRGEGETAGSCDGSCGKRTSSLKFWSDDPKSLIVRGAGYWQYAPEDDGIRFITKYDYQTRFGAFGQAIDRALFRPLLGWATAWSFDRLRLWLEQGIDPSVSLRHSLIHVLSRLAVAFVWIYQGLIPKLIARHADELAMMADGGIRDAQTTTLCLVGAAEVLMGIFVLTCFRRRWPMIVTMLLMVLATWAVAVNSPRFLVAAFNPVSLNLLLAIVALIDLLVMGELPSARMCLRKERSDG